MVVSAFGDAPSVNNPRGANNSRAVASEILTRAADLRVTNIQVPPENLSGELATIQYQVTNFGDAVWSGTQYWTDSVYFSRSPVFDPRNVTLLGTYVRGNGGGLAAGGSYSGTVQGASRSASRVTISFMS